MISDSESESSDVEFDSLSDVSIENPGCASEEGDFSVTDPPDSSSSSSSESDLAPEIWDSDSESDDESEAGGLHSLKFHYIPSYFLLFFQLCYHVSEFDFVNTPTILQSDKTVPKLATDFPKSLKKQFNMKPLSSMYLWGIQPRVSLLDQP